MEYLSKGIELGLIVVGCLGVIGLAGVSGAVAMYMLGELVDWWDQRKIRERRRQIDEDTRH